LNRGWFNSRIKECVLPHEADENVGCGEGFVPTQPLSHKNGKNILKEVGQTD